MLQVIKTKDTMSESDLISSLTLKIGKKLATEEDKFIMSNMPKWWVWCVKKGGLLSRIANIFIRVYIISEK